ncbi:MAG: MBL fold metallo-hydrolase [Bacteroidetes bacterium]|nr:MBL fold metallo-hydrolase [Bacteroidota bacterium]
MLSIQTFTFNAFSENTYVVSDETKEAVIIDPGCYTREEQQELTSFVESNGLKIKFILNTHCHVDHVLGNYFAKEKFKAPLLIHQIEDAQLRAVKNYAPVYGFTSYAPAEPDQFIGETDVIEFGNSSWKIFFLPGHAPGHIGFYDEKEKVIFAGDVLFAGSIGRTDLPGGNFDTLIKSIHQKLFVLPDDVEVFPGHGPTTTIGEEKVSNPFCALSLLR